MNTRNEREMTARIKDDPLFRQLVRTLNQWAVCPYVATGVLINSKFRQRWAMKVRGKLNER
jgi:hypothetical protein